MVKRVSLNDALVPVTVTFVDRDTGAALDLSAYDTFELLVEDPAGASSTVSGSAGGATGELDATVAVFDSAGTWKLRGRASASGSGAQRTTDEILVECES